MHCWGILVEIRLGVISHSVNREKEYNTDRKLRHLKGFVTNVVRFEL